MPGRSRLARALLYDLLNGTIGIPGNWRIASEQSGRPILSGYAGVAPSVSIAHSAGWVACGLAQDGEIGVDLEEHRPERNWTEIAASVFGPQESSRTMQEGISGFYRIWSLREALSKATGAGLAAVTDKKDRVEGGPLKGRWSATIDGSFWSLWHEEMACRMPQNRFSLAVAIRHSAKMLSASPASLKWWHLPDELQMMQPRS